MCNQAILENSGTLNYVPDCYENQEMYQKAVDNYPNASEFVPECFMTQKMCDKKVHRWLFFVFYYIPDQCKSQ